MPRFVSVFVCLVLVFASSHHPAQAQCLDMLSPLDLQAEDSFGTGIAIDGDRALISAYEADEAAIDAGVSYIFERDGQGVWQPVAKLIASDAASDDLCGIWVDLDGDRAILGAFNGDGVAADTGAAYIFERQNDGTWSQTAKLFASDGVTGHAFGTSVAISGDTAVVGASQRSALRGAVYVYDFDGTQWNESQILTCSGARVRDFFGHSVALDGNTLIAGAFRYDGPGTRDSGAAFIFDRAGSTWVETIRLLPRDIAAGDRFGIDVDVEGGRAVVGSREADVGADNTGAGYVFERSPGGWVETAKLVHADRQGGDEAGNKIALSGDRVLLGVWLADQSRGAAYLFELTDQGWRQGAKMEAQNAEPSDILGHDVALDGHTAMAGAQNRTEATFECGAAFVLVAPELTLTPSASDVRVGDRLELRTEGGHAGQPVGLLLLAIDGVPVTTLVAQGVFDPEGSWVVQATVPALSSGTEFILQSVGLGQCDTIDTTETITIRVQ